MVIILNKKTFLIAVIILILDQVSKSLIEVFIGLNESVKIIANFWFLTCVHNTGGAWSIFSEYTSIFIIASVIIILFLIKFMFGFKNNLRNNIGFGLLFGGVFSNLADRIFLGYVRDFLDFKIFGYNCPVFNIADIAIVIGVFLLIIAIIKGEDQVEKNN